MRHQFLAALAASAGVLCSSSPVRSEQVTIVTDGSLTRENRPPERGTGVVLGRTLDPATGQPVPGAVVYLRMGNTGLDPVMSDEQGRFVFRDLPKGRLTLNATKPGYVYGKYGKHLPDSGLDVNTDWQPLDLDDNGRAGDVVIFLWKHAAIGGRVVDERDDPIVGVNVRALRATYTGGRRRFSTRGQMAVTDDRGIYRFSDLIPGEHMIAVPIDTSTWPKSLQRLLASPATAAPPGFSDSTTYGGRWSGGSLGRTGFDTNDERFAFSVTDRFTPIAGVGSDGRLLTYETQFYPGVSTVSRASVIALGSGEERSGIDLQMRPVATVRLSGTLMGPDGPGANLLLRLVPADAAALSDDPEVNSAVADADGAFTFLGVVPGEYVIKVLLTPRPVAPPLPPNTTTTVRSGGGGGSVVSLSADRPNPLPTEPTLWAEMPIAVGDQDIRDLAVTLRKGARIMGRVEYDGTPAPGSSRLDGTYIERADGSQSVNLNLLLGRVDAQDNFSSFGEPPGRYFVRVPWAVQGWNFEGAMLGDRDLSVTPIELGAEDVTGVVLKLTTRPLAELSGTVRVGSALAPAGASVIVFPTDRATWNELGQNPPHVRSVAVVSDGRYLISGLPPGEYFVAATREARTDWCEPRRLDAVARQAVRVTITRGEKRTQDLSVPARAADDLGVEAASDQAKRPHGPSADDAPSDTQDPPARDARPAAPAGSGVISGTVVTGDRATPLRRAQVTLTGAAQAGNRLTLSDDEGRFAFTNVPAGRFTLAAAKPAYIRATYGASRPGRPGTPITLADGQRVADITLNLVRGAVITGVITDTRGQPITGAAVSVLRYVTTNGVKRLQTVQSIALGRFQTDDRGVFRIHSLEAAEYGVGASVRLGGSAVRPTSAADVQFALNALRSSASGATPAGTSRPAPPSTASERSMPISYVPVFYPGTSDPSQAVMITVAAGEERGGINFTVQPVAAATVSGTVVGPSGAAPANTEIRIINVGNVVTIDPFDGLMTGLPMRPQPNGAFAFTGVTPGRHAVVASTGAAGGRGAPPATGPFLWAATEVVVAGRDEPNLQFALQPGITVSGTIVFERTTLTPPVINTVRAALNPILTGTQVAVGQFNGTVGDDGTFRIAVMPGRYTARALLPAGSTGWVLKSAVANGRDTADEGLDVRAGEEGPSVTITLTDRPSEISGTLQDATGRPAPDYFIIVFPADKTKWSSGARRIQQLRPGTDGRFTARNLPAGEYRIAALTDVAPGEAFDPAFLERLVAHTVAVTLAEGEKKVQDIRVGGG
jgi:hypothetical protein